MRPQNPLKLSTNAFQRSTRALVARVRMKADAEYPPRLESMRQHKQLGRGVGGSPDCRAGEPRVADLTSVGKEPGCPISRVLREKWGFSFRISAVPRMSLRPRPSLQVPETRRSDDGTVIQVKDSERHCCASIPPSQGSLDIAGSLNHAPRHRTPLVERGITCGSSHQAVDVAMIKRFETNVPARQHKTFCWHDSQYATAEKSVRLTHPPSAHSASPPAAAVARTAESRRWRSRALPGAYQCAPARRTRSALCL